MWNVPAGLFNWLLPGTGLPPSLLLNFGTAGASGSSKRFETQAILICVHGKEKLDQQAEYCMNFNSFVKQFRANSSTTFKTEQFSKIQDIPRNRTSCSATLGATE